MRPAAVFHANRVVASSASARHHGVVRHLRRRESQSRCPHLDVIDADPDRDARRFEPVVAALDELTPRIELIRPGLCAFATRGPSRYFGGDDAVAGRAKTLVERCCPRMSHPGRCRRRSVRGSPSRPASGSEPGRGQHRAGGGEPVVPRPRCRFRPPSISPTWSTSWPVSGSAAWATCRPAGRRRARPLRDEGRGRSPARVRTRRPTSDRPNLPPTIWSMLDRTRSAGRCGGSGRLRVPRGSPTNSNAGSPHDGSACTRIVIGAETEHGEIHERVWRHEGALSAGAIADRLRWQLDGWLNGSIRHRPTAGIARLWLIPEEIVAADGRQLGFWGGDAAAAQRAIRALARVQGLLGTDDVAVPEFRGGRSPIEQVALVPAATVDLEGGRPAAHPSVIEAPWPGRIPAPAPANVFTDPPRVDVLDQAGVRVGVTGRGEPTADPVTRSHRPPPRGRHHRLGRALAGRRTLVGTRPAPAPSPLPADDRRRHRPSRHPRGRPVVPRSHVRFLSSPVTQAVLAGLLVPRRPRVLAAASQPHDGSVAFPGRVVAVAPLLRGRALALPPGPGVGSRDRCCFLAILVLGQPILA